MWVAVPVVPAVAPVTVTAAAPEIVKGAEGIAVEPAPVVLAALGLALAAVQDAVAVLVLVPAPAMDAVVHARAVVQAAREIVPAPASGPARESATLLAPQSHRQKRSPISDSILPWAILSKPAITHSSN